MKKFLYLTAVTAIAAAIVGIPSRVPAHAAEITAAGKSAYLADAESGTVVYAREETKRLPIASMCKIMTLILSFEAVDLSYGEMLTVSANASGMGGSQVFLETGLSYSAEELMKTVAVCSANDSCVALAERIAGSEAEFVSRMNARAKELGAENTLFANCTGLPKDPQYSCAKDVSLMLRELLRHEKYFEFSRVWYEDFQHPDGRTTRITNTNKLIKSYSGCDGGKTGFTGEAGFCLAATAKRGDTRLVAVVIGASDSKTRFVGITTMLDYAFNRYTTKTLLAAGEPLAERAPIRGGKISELAVMAEQPLKAFTERGKEGDFSVEIALREGLRAPLRKGEEVGCARLLSSGVEVHAVRLVAAEDAPRMSWWDACRETARNWQ